MRWLSIRALATIGVAVLTVLVMALDFREHDTAKPSTAASQHAVTTLQTELQRCQLLGKAAADDADCTKAWAENRRRFFGSEVGVAAKANTPFKREARTP
jgi:conjugative transfer region protein TrbK